MAAAGGHLHMFLYRLRIGLKHFSDIPIFAPWEISSAAHASPYLSLPPILMGPVSVMKFSMKATHPSQSPSLVWPPNIASTRTVVCSFVIFLTDLVPPSFIEPNGCISIQFNTNSIPNQYKINTNLIPNSKSNWPPNNLYIESLQDGPPPAPFLFRKAFSAAFTTFGSWPAREQRSGGKRASSDGTQKT